MSLPEAVKGAVFTLQDAAETLRDPRRTGFFRRGFDRGQKRACRCSGVWERKYNMDEAGLIDTLQRPGPGSIRLNTQATGCRSSNH